MAETTSPDFAVKHKSQELIDYGTIALRAGDLPRAKGAFEAAWGVFPSPESLDGLGCVAFLKGEFIEAEELFMRAVSLDESYADAIGNLALLYETLGMKEKARLLYEKGIRADPINFKARNNYGALLTESGDADLGGGEILRAEALSRHPLIIENATRIGF